MIRRNSKLLVLHLVANALLLWLAYEWLGVDESSTGRLLLSAMDAVAILALFCWLYGATLVWFHAPAPRLNESFRTALRHIGGLLALAIAGFVLYGLAAKGCRDHRGSGTEDCLVAHVDLSHTGEACHHNGDPSSDVLAAPLGSASGVAAAPGWCHRRERPPGLEPPAGAPSMEVVDRDPPAHPGRAVPPPDCVEVDAEAAGLCAGVRKFHSARDGGVRALSLRNPRTGAKCGPPQ